MRMTGTPVQGVAPAYEFPLAFPYLRKTASARHPVTSTTRFVVAAMYTGSYAALAERFRTSADVVGLPWVAYEVPTVHRSISPRGSPDPRFTKANFISFLLREYQRPILYVDIDCKFVSFPDRLEELIAAQCDFAIYNWLADEHTDAFKSVEVSEVGASGETIMVRDRYFAFASSIDFMASDQLICSGAVQFYGNSAGTHELLKQWHGTILSMPNVADEHCLDFTYNNLQRIHPLRVQWLQKSYARYPFWIYVTPVIDHPDDPNPGIGFVPINESSGRKRYYPERATRIVTGRLFPRECVIDVKAGILLVRRGNELIPVARTLHAFSVRQANA